MNFLISPAQAQEAGSLLSGSGIAQFLPLILIFVVFYFLMIRPQQQSAKALKAQLATLKKGDRVLTAGGILGVVQKARDGSNEIEVEIAPGVKVTVARDTIGSLQNTMPAAANDPK